MAVAPLITRGLGASPRIITLGLTPFNITPPEIIRRRLIGGSKARKKKPEKLYDVFVVHAQLVSVNGEEQISSIKKSTQIVYRDQEFDVETKIMDVDSMSPSYKIIIDNLKVIVKEDE